MFKVAADAEARKDLNRVADLRYGAIPETERAIKALIEKKRQQDESSAGGDNKMLSEKVGPDEIAMVISRLVETDIISNFSKMDWNSSYQVDQN